MNALAPLITHSPSSSTARVLVAPASEPASGSVRPKPASARPATRSGSQLLLLLVGAEGQDRVDAEADAGLEGDADRLVDAAELLDRDAQRGEVARPRRRTPRARSGRTGPSSPIACTTSTGKWCSRSHCATCGAISRLGEVAHDLAEGLVLLRTARTSSASSSGLTFTSTSSNDSRVTTRERKSDGPGRSASWPTSSASPPARCASTRPRAWSARAAAGTNRVYSQRDRARLRLILRGRRFGMSAGRVPRDRRHVRRRGLVRAAPAARLLLGRLDEIAADLRARQADLRRTLTEVDDVAEQCRDRLAEVALTHTPSAPRGRAG